MVLCHNRSILPLHHTKETQYVTIHCVIAHFETMKTGFVFLSVHFLHSFTYEVMYGTISEQCIMKPDLKNTVKALL